MFGSGGHAHCITTPLLSACSFVCTFIYLLTFALKFYFKLMVLYFQHMLGVVGWCDGAG